MKVEPPLPAEVLAPIRAPFEGPGALGLIDAPILCRSVSISPARPCAAASSVQGDGEDAALRASTSRSRSPAPTSPMAWTSARYFYEGKAFRVATEGSGRSRNSRRSGSRSSAAAVPTSTPRWRAWPGGRQRPAAHRPHHDPRRHRLAAMIDAMALAPALGARLWASARGGT